MWGTQVMGTTVTHIMMTTTMATLTLVTSLSIITVIRIITVIIMIEIDDRFVAMRRIERKLTRKELGLHFLRCLRSRLKEAKRISYRNRSSNERPGIE